MPGGGTPGASARQPSGRQDQRSIHRQRDLLDLGPGRGRVPAPCRDGLKAWREAVERGYEGLMAKDPASPYVSGRTPQVAAEVPRGGEGILQALEARRAGRPRKAP
jgi:hypothetical protein